MKFAIDITYTPSGGSLSQIQNMIKYVNEDKNNNLLIFSKNKNKNLIKNVIKNENVIIFSWLSNFSVITRVIWQQLFLPFYLKKMNVDILFSPGNITPLISPVKTVLWIGTIGPFFRDFYKGYSFLSNFKDYFNKFFMIMSSYSSNAVIFESNFTKNLFIKKYRINPLNTHVINIGKDNFFKEMDQEQEKLLEIKYKKNIPFSLCVSHLYPYKNIINMLKAYKKSMDSTGIKTSLLIAGQIISKSYNHKINNCIEELEIKESIIFLGAVPKEDLKYLYSKCEFLIFPSPIENFAYTLVAAMSCGAPITCSNTTAMPETCKNAAIYFDPNDINDISERISDLLSNRKLRKTLKLKSLARVKELPNYEEVTIQTLKIMNKVMRGGY